MAQFFVERLNLSNINRFSKLFHCQNQEKICNNIITNRDKESEEREKKGAGEVKNGREGGRKRWDGYSLALFQYSLKFVSPPL